MKEFSLSVPEPCHESWDEMRPEQKGRFCSSCQKTVVDFTGMTDRQLADFFRQYKGNACGRFYHDQLNRTIAIPGQISSLPKHFFRYAWPALLLSLQACNERHEKTEAMGKAIVETQIPPRMPPATGNLFLQTTPIDSARSKLETISVTETVGILIIESKIDSSVIAVDDGKSESKNNIDTSFVAIDRAQLFIDTLTLSGHAVEPSALKMGEVSVADCQAVKQEKTNAERKSPESKTLTQPIIYPNPVARGQSLTVVLETEFAGLYQICSLSGQVVKEGRITVGKDQRFSVPVEPWPAGMYVIRVVEETSSQSFTQKCVVQ